VRRESPSSPLPDVPVASRWHTGYRSTPRIQVSHAGRRDFAELTRHPHKIGRYFAANRVGTCAVRADRHQEFFRKRRSPTALKAINSHRAPDSASAENRVVRREPGEKTGADSYPA